MKEVIAVLTMMVMYLLSALFVQDWVGEWVGLYCTIMTTLLVFIVFPLLTKTRD